ncbi:sensor histidine kinase [Micromonospora zhanjiangensis]
MLSTQLAELLAGRPAGLDETFDLVAGFDDGLTGGLGRLDPRGTAALTDLAGALAGLAGSCAVPCRLEVDVAVRCAASVEATAYFVVAEALTNVAKHSGAGQVDVTVRRERGRLLVTVQDDGHGDADEARGSGLTGIRRRVEAYDGRMGLTSPPGGPTRMDVELPCGS